MELLELNDNNNKMEIEEIEHENEKHILEEKYKYANEIMDALPMKSIEKFQDILHYDEDDKNLEICQRMKEHSIYKLGQIYTQHGREKELGELLKSVRPFFLTIPKSKTGKIVRTIIDMVSRVKAIDSKKALQLQEDLCIESIAWCNLEKHIFLRQRIEARLAAILYEQEKYQKALELTIEVLHQIKKMDDKNLLVELHLLESKIYHSIYNLPKSKASLTAARSISNAIYISPKIQAEIDEMSGKIHTDEKDYKTGYSYFYEAFEALAQLTNNVHQNGIKNNDILDDSFMKKNDNNIEYLAFTNLKYMLLCKIANDEAKDMSSILNNNKYAMKYRKYLEYFIVLSIHYDEHSLENFEKNVKKYENILNQDMFIKRHLNYLYDKLMEANLMKILLPYSCIEISHVAKKIKLPLSIVEIKIAQMILDKKFHGILDQGKGQIIIYTSPVHDKIYANGLKIIDNVGHVVDTLFRRSEHIHT